MWGQMSVITIIDVVSLRRGHGVRQVYYCHILEGESISAALVAVKIVSN